MLSGCNLEKKINLLAPKHIYSPSENDKPLSGPFPVYKTEKLPQTEEKIPGLYFLSGKIIGANRGQRAFIIIYIGKDEIMVFDTGQRNFGYNGNDIKNAIRQVSDKPINTIYLTHRHFDHTGNAISLQEALENRPTYLYR